MLAAGLCPHATASISTGSAAGVMRPGMTIHGMMFPMDPLAGPAGGLFRAEKATVDAAPGRLLLDGLRYSAGPAFSLAAPRAVYEGDTGFLQAPSGFAADGETLRIRGDALAGVVKTRCFNLTGFVEIRMKPRFVPIVALAGKAPLSQEGWRMPSSLPFPCMPPEHSEDRIARFALRLDHYERCMTAAADLTENQAITLVGRAGGRLALPDHELRIEGPAAIFGSGMMLACEGGIHVFEEDGGFRATASGQVEAWVHPEKPDAGTTIRCASFECAGSGEVLQFQGGPMVVRKQGMTLSATESWQFLRVFEGGRIVLGPGAWNMEGGAFPPG